MKAVKSLYAYIDKILQHTLTPLLPLLARLVFAATLLPFFINSAWTKIGASPFSPSIGAYAQILPQKAATLNYNPASFSWLDWLIVMAGTYGEIILPVLIVIGLMTRLAALGMTGFIFVMTFVDINGHNVMAGLLFDRHINSVIDQRVFWVFLLIVIAGYGAGRFSCDHLLCRKIPSGQS